MEATYLSKGEVDYQSHRTCKAKSMLLPCYYSKSFFDVDRAVEEAPVD